MMGNCEHSTLGEIKNSEQTLKKSLGHTLTNGNMFLNIFRWYKNLILGNVSPEISWDHGFDGDILWASLTIEGELLPDEVNIKYTETVEEKRTTLWRKDLRSGSCPDTTSPFWYKLLLPGREQLELWVRPSY